MATIVVQALLNQKPNMIGGKNFEATSNMLEILHIRLQCVKQSTSTMSSPFLVLVFDRKMDVYSILLFISFQGACLKITT